MAKAAEERGVVKYQAKGQEITLSAQIIRDFLVVGNKELVTDQEIYYYMGICKSRGLNPFNKDCYLIKYTQDPAAIVIAIDFYRSRARAAADCVGWEKGVIVMQPDAKPYADGELVRYSKGLVLPHEILVGGWFRARPEGWKVDFLLEVNLEGYIKTKRDGSITKFWSKENQPSQIMKVAESQGLRTLWPDLFQGTYTADEMGYDLEKPLNITPEPPGATPAPEPEPETAETKEFDKLAQKKLKALKLDAEALQVKQERLAKYLADTAASWKDRVKGDAKKAQMTVGYVKTQGVKNFEGLWTAFGTWEASSFPAEAEGKPGAVKEEPPQAITTEQFDKLDSTPLEILQQAYKNCEVAIGLDPKELDFETAEKLVAEVAKLEAAAEDADPFAPPAQDPKVVTFDSRAQTVFNQLLQKGMPISELADLGVNGMADITAENIDQVIERVANYKPKRGK